MAAPDSAFPLLPDEDVRHAQPATTLLTAGARGLAPIGTLFITTLRVVWLKEGAASPPADGDLFAYDYPSIGLHAICTDDVSAADGAAEQPAAGAPCLYLQIDGGAGGEGEGGIGAWLDGPPADGPAASDAADNDAGDDDNGDEPLREVRLAPADAAALPALFRVMSECAALHPCGDDDDDDDDDAMDGDDGDGDDDGDASDGGDDDDGDRAAADPYASLAAGELPPGFHTGDGPLSAAQRAVLERFDAMLAVGPAAHEAAADASAALGEPAVDACRFEDAARMDE